jgi:hypothetical protein
MRPSIEQSFQESRRKRQSAAALSPDVPLTGYDFQAEDEAEAEAYFVQSSFNRKV